MWNRIEEVGRETFADRAALVEKNLASLKRTTEAMVLDETPASSPGRSDLKEALA